MSVTEAGELEKHLPKWAFSYRETAAISGLSPSTIRRLVRLGELECVRTGRAVRIPIHAVRKLCGLPCADRRHR